MILLLSITTRYFFLKYENYILHISLILCVFLILILYIYIFQVDIFYAAIDSQLQKLNSRFNENVVELVILSSALDPREINLSFRIDDICKLVDKYYPQDFEDHEKTRLKRQLEHFGIDVIRLPEFKTLLNSF